MTSPAQALLTFHGNPGQDGAPRDGPDPSAFLRQVKELQIIKRWDNQQTANMAHSFLQGKAADRFQGKEFQQLTLDRQNLILHNFEDGFMPFFRQIFSAPFAASSIDSGQLYLQQRPKETCRIFYTRAGLSAIATIANLPTSDSLDLTPAVLDLLERSTPAKRTIMLEAFFLRQTQVQQATRGAIINSLTNSLTIRGLRMPLYRQLFERAVSTGSSNSELRDILMYWDEKDAAIAAEEKTVVDILDQVVMVDPKNKVTKRNNASKGQGRKRK
jgi:hypothetical protein